MCWEGYQIRAISSSSTPEGALAVSRECPISVLRAPHPCLAFFARQGDFDLSKVQGLKSELRRPNSYCGLLCPCCCAGGGCAVPPAGFVPVGVVLFGAGFFFGA